MHKSRFVTPLVIFVAAFALSTVLDVRHLVSRAQGTLSKTAVPQVAAQAAQTPSIPQRWEYRVVRASKGGLLSGGKEDIDKALTALGAEGFEICWATQSSSDVGYYLTVILRRPQ
jgi:hypothetical protein